MKSNYDTERGAIIAELAAKLEYLTEALKAAQADGDTKEYRALLKSYTDTAKLHLSLVREEQAEDAATDALTEFVTGG
jgi:hypothetical protein